MSGRLTRALLRLYPAQVRDRYGAELLDLQDQLRADGELSRGRLLRDVLVGAVLARSVRRRASLLAVALVFVVVVAASVTLTGGHHSMAGRSAGVSARVPAHVERTLSEVRSSCYTDPSSMTCSYVPCTMHIRPLPRVAHQPSARRAREVCVPSPPDHRPKGLPLPGATPQPTALRRDTPRVHQLRPPAI